MATKKQSASKAKASPKTPQGMPPLQRVSSGNAGLDQILGGGFPRGRVMLAVGAAGSGKTVFALQFLVEGIEKDKQNGVMVSFEESPEDIAANGSGFGWDIDRLTRTGKLVISHMNLDVAGTSESGDYDLSALFIRLQLLIDKVKAERIVLDGINNLLGAFQNEKVVRSELLRLFRWLKDRGLSVFVTGEKGTDNWSRMGLEEYLTDGLIVLDQRVDGSVGKRTLRVIKCRGISHGTDEYPFLISSDGPEVFPIEFIEPNYRVGRRRISTGIDGLDQMLSGKGVYAGSTVLVGGTAGTGKSTIGASFANAACQRGEKALFFCFEEAPSQIKRNMGSVGLDLAGWEKQGLLRFEAARALQNSAEGHFTQMQHSIRQFQPQVVVIDPISSLSMVSDDYEIHSVLVRLSHFLRHLGITCLMTNLGREVNGEITGSLTISSIADTWVVVRTHEQNIERIHTIQVIKSRGMKHSNQLREFEFTPQGLHTIQPYIGVNGAHIGSARLAAQAKDHMNQVERDKAVEARHAQLIEKRSKLNAQLMAMQADFDAEAREIEAEYQAYKERQQAQQTAIKDIRKERGV